MPSRVPRHTLSRDRVLAAALDLADREGLERLTIRALADELGVRPMGLYRHVRDKQEILDLLLDLVYTEIGVPDPAGEWQEELRDRSRRLRRVLLRHPWVVGLVGPRTSAVRPATVAQHEAVLATLCATGASTAAATRAYLVLDGYVWGFVLQERSLPTSTSAEGALIGDRPAPYLRRALQELLGARDADEALESEFMAGLDLVLGVVGTIIGR